jgi:hypothetical protein
MSGQPKDTPASKELDPQLSGLEPQELLIALGVDFDIDAQLTAIHGLLQRNRQAEAELVEEIKSADERTRRLEGVLNDWAVDDWVDRVHHYTYQGAAHSMAAAGMLAPLVETVLHQCFLGIGSRLYPITNPKTPHDRWSSAHALQWDCHQFFSAGRARKDVAKGIVQLMNALGLTNTLPADFGQTISALFTYRNAMFHNGFEWPIEEREKFAKQAAQWPSDWFSLATSGGKPWIFYMSDTFIDQVLNSIDQALKVLGQFVADNWPEGQTF